MGRAAEEDETSLLSQHSEETDEMCSLNLATNPPSLRVVLVAFLLVLALPTPITGLAALAALWLDVFGRQLPRQLNVAATCAGNFRAAAAGSGAPVILPSGGILPRSAMSKI